MGTIVGISDFDPLRWPGSKWRNLQVAKTTFLVLCSYQISIEKGFCLWALLVPLLIIIVFLNLTGRVG